MPLSIFAGAFNAARLDRLSSRWLWLLPILLVVAALALRDSDVYPPAEDEFYSMNNAGWLHGGDWSPGEINAALRRNSPNHTPLYFWLLSLWGSLTSPDILMARLLGVLLLMPALAMTYRLGADLVAPAAGLFALLIASSNAFYNYYIAFARMYVLLTLLAAIVLWLYLRLIYHIRRARARDFLALTAAIWCLVNTSLVSALFLLTLGLFHLLFAPKNQRWIIIGGVFLLALLLFTPQLLAMLPFQFTGQVGMTDWIPLRGAQAGSAWLTVSLNKQLWLLPLALLGLALGPRKLRQTWLLLPLIFLSLLAFVAQSTDLIAADTMRYHLPDWLPLTLLMAASLYGFYRYRPWLALLLILWLLAGASFQQSARWYDWLGGRAFVYNRQPIHAISRLAVMQDPPPAILGYGFDSFWLDWKPFTEHSQRDHYFSKYGIRLDEPADRAAFHDIAHRYAVVESRLWLAYHPRDASPADQEFMLDTLNRLNYQHCAESEIGKGTVILEFRWRLLDCAPPTVALSSQNQAIRYEFIAAETDDARQKLILHDRFYAKQGATPEQLALSYQLLDADYEKRAQVDLPLAHRGRARMFTMDIADAPPGQYTLMAIVYDKRSGERLTWQAGGPLLSLREISILGPNDE